MIRITGDIHGAYERLKHFPPITREDYVIVLGDFGVVWDGSPEEDKALDELDALGLTVLFLDGNHENFDLLGKYPVTEWHGGKVQFLREHVIHLMRGQVYQIDKQKFFVMGGAQSHDADIIIGRDDPDAKQKIKNAERRYQSYRMEGVSWWPEELPDDGELEEGLRNLAAAGNRVDVVLSHCAPSSLQQRINPEDYAENRLTEYLEQVRQTVDYSLWFFGHYHDDRAVDDKHVLLYEGVVALARAMEPDGVARLFWKKKNGPYRLDQWHLYGKEKFDGYDGQGLHTRESVIAQGTVYGNPRFPDGRRIHTSVILSCAFSPDAMTVTTRSGSIYTLRYDQVNAAAPLDEALFRKLGIGGKALRRLRSRVREQKMIRQREAGEQLGGNELYLEVAGCESVAAAWFMDENGTLHTIEPLCHSGMFQDSWLMCEDGVVDFRLFSHWMGWEPYHVSDNIARVHIRNLSGRDICLQTRNYSAALPAGKTVTVEKEFLQGTEGLFSPDCYNGKSILSQLGARQSGPETAAADREKT